ncbi:DUF4147 domain-containing protein [Patescibacteria group bacterium]|nr:DUF4147 domain-containing protein [Patescibacteria group bacterium]
MGRISNSEALASTPERAAALAIAEAGLAAIDTRTVIERHVSVGAEGIELAGEFHAWGSYDRLLVAGVGKCALDAAYALEELLGDRIDDGVVVDVRCDSGVLSRIRSCEGTHPYPSAENIGHTRALLTLLESATERDLVLLIVSGGGSTLLCQPKTHTCESEEDLIHALFRCGATIAELNTVRKHLSLARGGGLAAAAHPARLTALIFSDVPGDDLATISSGPTVRDESTIEDARAVLARFSCEGIDLPEDALFETPKDPVRFSTTRNVLALTNRTALEAMAEAARAAGYEAQIVTATLTGDAEVVARNLCSELSEMSPGSVHLYGGETTVEVQGDGDGGRNQHLALAALPCIPPSGLLLTLASDGCDKGAHAGAIADAVTRRAAQQAGCDPEDFRARSDSYTFFHRVHQGLTSGYTGSNVADLSILLTSH